MDTLFDCPICNRLTEWRLYEFEGFCTECGFAFDVIQAKREGFLRPNTASRPTALAAVQSEYQALPAQRLKHGG